MTNGAIAEIDTYDILNTVTLSLIDETLAKQGYKGRLTPSFQDKDGNAFYQYYVYRENGLDHWRFMACVSDQTLTIFKEKPIQDRPASATYRAIPCPYWYKSKNSRISMGSVAVGKDNHNAIAECVIRVAQEWHDNRREPVLIISQDDQRRMSDLMMKFGGAVHIGCDTGGWPKSISNIDPTNTGYVGHISLSGVEFVPCLATKLAGDNTIAGDNTTVSGVVGWGFNLSAALDSLETKINQLLKEGKYPAVCVDVNNRTQATGPLSPSYCPLP